jgi:tripartite-type tricarboxylate transporter receptor subunit TctC
LDGATRSALFPDLPTVAEAGLPGYEAVLHYGIVAPAGTPREVVDRLNREISAAIADPTFRTRIGELGGEAIGGTPAEFGTFMADYTQKWAKVIRFANIKID